MDALDDPNVYTDVEVPVGCDLTFGFQLEPWDATGTTATFTVGGTSFSMMITVLGGGTPDATSQYTVHLTPAQMATLGLNVIGATASYNVRWTASNGAVWALGYGLVVATS